MSLPAINAARQADAVARAKAIASHLTDLDGLPTRQAAAELNRRKIATPSGKPWTAMAVHRARARLAP